MPFCIFIANEKLCHSTIKCYLAAIRHLNIAEGYGNPHISHMARLKQVLKGIKALQSKSKVPMSTPRLPITLALLTKLKEAWANHPEGRMLWASAFLCFFGFLRSGELTIPSDLAYDEGAHLSFNDIAVDSTQVPRLLRVCL